VFFHVGAIVGEFPTLYPALQPGGFVVADLNDILGGIAVASSAAHIPDAVQGPNEYWLRTTTNPAQEVALRATVDRDGGRLNIAQRLDRAQLDAQIASNPIQSGMRGLLTVGAILAAALAVLGSIVQSVVATRQRAVQFAVLRTIGLTNRQLSGVLFGEQLVVLLFGLLGGTVLGLVLASATLPFLQFSDTSVNPATLGIPPYVLAVDPSVVLGLYAVLLVAFAVALAVAARFAATVGLGKTLRLGED
jgi:predicted lysophospholipase L1 biosynthesis ABC-type transport system permease subunit